MSNEDLFIAAMARELHDGDRLFVGINQVDVALAAFLARALWAPRLHFWASSAAYLDSSQDALRVGRGTLESVLVTGRDSTFLQARAFDDALRAPLVFAGGIQVDHYGNANLAGIHDGDRWLLRGPGSAGLPSLTALAERFFLIVPFHERRSLVPECSRISVVGHPARRAELGLTAGALKAVITPIATFIPSESGLILTEAAPGTSIDEIADRTGFPIQPAENVGTRPALTNAEQTALDQLRIHMNRNREHHGSPNGG